MQAEEQGAPRVLRILSALGGGFFALCFCLAFFFPATLESRARSFVVERIVHDAGERFEQLEALPASQRLQGLSDFLSARADSLRSAIDVRLAPGLTALFSEFCEYDCPATDSLEVGIASLSEGVVSDRRTVAETAMSWARGHYGETMTALVRDLRIFTGSNAALFLLVLLGSFGAAGRDRGLQVLLWLLLAATGVAVFGYLFVQDWLYTVLLGNYVGYGYLVWVAALFLVLCDYVLNRARITNAVFSSVTSLVGGLSSLG